MKKGIPPPPPPPPSGKAPIKKIGSLSAVNQIRKAYKNNKGELKSSFVILEIPSV